MSNFYRIEFEDEKSHTNELRLQKLAGFQITLLRHALNNFKSVKRIVYSTCSIFPQENEQVVQQAITTTPNFKLVPLNETLKDRWYNFGSKDYSFGPKCLYAKSEIDRTNGFFIAVFERLKEGEKNEYFVKRIQRTSECENKGANINLEGTQKLKKMKRSKNNSECNEILDTNTQECKNMDENVNFEHKKRKKVKNCDTENDFDKKQKVKNITNYEIKTEEENNFESENGLHNESKKKKKKRSKHSNLSSEVPPENQTQNLVTDINVVEAEFENLKKSDQTKPKKKKQNKHKQHNLAEEASSENHDLNFVENAPEEIVIKKKSKKRKNHTNLSEENAELSNSTELNDNTENYSKKNKRKKVNTDRENDDVTNVRTTEPKHGDSKKCKKKHKDKEKN